MFRTHTCGELGIALQMLNKEVTLAGWVQTMRKFGSITFIDLRDRYGVTQLVTGRSPERCTLEAKHPWEGNL